MRTIFFILLFISSINLTQENSNFYEKTALNWLKNVKQETSYQVKSVYFQKNDLGKILYYIINTEPAGFVIVSSDDTGNSILGYSTENNYNQNKKNPFLENYNTFPSKELGKNTSALIQQKSYNEFVKPLIESQWGQGEYYNNHFPQDENSTVGNGKVWVGCVAVAMAQIVKYHEHPKTAYGNISYNTDYGNITIDFTDTEFNWGNISNKLDENSSDNEINAVSDLLFKCASAIRTNYRPNESLTNIGKVTGALFDNFKYSSSISLLKRKDYSDEQWIEILKNELDNSRPVLYESTDEYLNLSHAFICDGYDENGFFHFNWGWDGLNDGYYLLSSLNPGRHDFSQKNRHNILAGIKPAVHITKDTTWNNGNINLDKDIIIRSGEKLSIEPGCNVVFTKPCFIDVQGQLVAEGTLEDNIIFTAADTLKGWRGIKFDRIITINDTSFITNSVIEYAKTNHLQQQNKFISPIFINSYNKLVFENNIVRNCYGINGGAISITNSNSVLFKSNKFNSNKSDFGGALFIKNSNVDIITSIFENNKSRYGGAVCAEHSSLYIESTQMSENSSESGGAVFIEGYTTEMEIINNTIVNNRASLNGGGIYCSEHTKTIITNSILYDNYVNDELNEIYNSLESDLTLRFCNLKNKEKAISFNKDIKEEHIYSVNPSFVEGSCELKDISPLINKGDPQIKLISSKDASNNDRIFGGLIDVGAFENQNAAWPSDFYLLEDEISFAPKNSKIDTLSCRIINISNPNLTIDLEGLDYPFTAELNKDTTLIHIIFDRQETGYFEDTLKIKTNLNTRKLIVKGYQARLVTGNVDGILRDKIVIISGTVNIPSMKYLEIKPGVKVLFDSNSRLNIIGNLVAKGTTNDSIYFCMTAPGKKFGGIHCYGESEFENCFFKGLKARLENGLIPVIHNYNQTIINRCKLSNDNNWADIYTDKNSLLQLTHTNIESNSTLGVNVKTPRVTLIDNCTIENCSNGINVYIQSNNIYEDKIKISKCFIMNNKIGIKTRSDTYNFSKLNEISIDNCVIANNIHSGVQIHNSSVKFTNNTIVFNGSKDRIGCGILSFEGSSTLLNNIIYGNEGSHPFYKQIYFSQYTTNEFENIIYNCNIQDSLKGVFIFPSSKESLIYQDNISIDPLFVDEDNSDYRLRKTSLCINSGTNNVNERIKIDTDILGNPRVRGCCIDIGAIEYDGIIDNLFNKIPTEIELFQNYPNPFNPTTRIQYGIPEECKVRLVIFNLLGERLEVLVDDVQKAGYHTINWNAKDVASGIYVYKLETGKKSIAKKMILLR